MNTFTIYVPPLRERPEDILPLAERLLKRCSREMRKVVDGFSPEASALLRGHPFPGNVRELRNTVERAVILCQGKQVTPEDLRINRHGPSVPEPDQERQGTRLEESMPGGMGDRPGRPNLTLVEDLSLDAVEKEVISEALRRSDGNQARAARLLGLSRMALHRRVRYHKL